ncbi:hypothetical protein ACFSCX_07095 [Bacillus salitolerans]|uniref:YtzI protein n=1 Tax=Bacillus salitolerans TaxID=1437434 RepID=A0ABW4LNN8_9BACI
MIWLIFVIPVVIICSIAIYFEKKSGAVPPDTNKGNHNAETIASNNDKNNFGGL